MPRVPQPVTAADWEAFERGEWPPKKTATKTVTKRAPAKRVAKKSPPVASQPDVTAPQSAAPQRKPRTISPKLIVDTPLRDPTSPLKGCEVPRIYTPPRHELTPDTSDGWACIQFAEDMLGLNLFPWQRWLLIHALELNDDLTYRFRTVIMEMARQNGKALSVDTPVLTTNGWSTMGALRVGDEVFHPDGHSTRVVNASDVMYDHVCYEVATTDGRKVVADADHLWTVKDTRRSKIVGGSYSKGGNQYGLGVGNRRGVRTHVWETLTTTQLLERGLRCSPQRLGNDFAFRLPQQQRIISKPVDLPIEPYMLGAWLGDGDHRDASLSVGNRDLDAMRRNLVECGAKIVSETRGLTCWRLGFNIAGAKIRDGFESRARRLAVWGDKHVPAIYLTAGTEQRKALLAGLLDTDGYISRSGQVGFTSTNERLADAVLYLARSLGWRATKRVTRSELNGRYYGPAYEICFTPNESPFRLQRKIDRVTERVGDRSAISIKSIQQVESRPVRCIKVDRADGLFLAGEGLTPTHNTKVMIVLALWHLYCKGSRTVIATAQDLSKAEDAWSGAVEMAQEDEELNELIRKISLAHPKLLKVLNPLTNKLCSYRVASKSRSGGRGFSGDLILLDELREHQSWDSWSAMSKTQMARPKGQTWAFTNAGDAMSVVWRYQRALAHQKLGWPDGDSDAAILGDIDFGVSELLAEMEKELGADLATGWFEWSAAPNAARTDRRAWAQANGSMNHADVVEDCVTERAIAHALHTDPVAVFDQEVMCRYVPFADGGPFPDGAWRDTVDDTAMPSPSSRSVVCVEVSTTRSASVIAKAALDVDGQPVVGVAETRPGTDWVRDWLLEQRRSYSGVVVRSGAGSPVLSLLQELVEAQLPVIEWKSTDVGVAYGQLFDHVKDHTIRHLSHPGLDSAACSALIKTQGAGGWIVDPVKSPSDVSALYAVCGSVWGIAQLPNDGPSIYAGPTGAEVLAF